MTDKGLAYLACKLAVPSSTQPDRSCVSRHENVEKTQFELDTFIAVNVWNVESKLLILLIDGRHLFVNRKSCPLCKNAIFDIRMLGEDRWLVVSNLVNTIFSPRISCSKGDFSISPAISQMPAKRGIAFPAPLAHCSITERFQFTSILVRALSLSLRLSILSSLVGNFWINADSLYSTPPVYSIGFPFDWTVPLSSFVSFCETVQ